MISDEIGAKFNRAMSLKEEGAYAEAVQLLLSLLASGQHKAAVTAIIGQTLYYDLNDPHRALPFLQESVELSPDSESASLGLFHALLAVDRVDDAFDEVRRYTREHASPAYEEFLRDVLKK